MVTHGIRHDPTVAAVRLLDACAQLKGDIHMDCSIGQEAKALCRDNQKPGPVVWCGGARRLTQSNWLAQANKLSTLCIEADLSKVWSISLSSGLSSGYWLVVKSSMAEARQASLSYLGWQFMV